MPHSGTLGTEGTPGTLGTFVALVDSLLSAIVRAEGEALVMHVGERPYVVVGTQTINISTQGLNLEAMTGMLAQLLPADAQSQLEEFGAVEYQVPPQGDDRFTIVTARGGDDVWIEIRRRQAKALKVPEVPVPANAQEAESATVVPLTRTVRIEVPHRAAATSSRASTDIERLLRIGAARGASAVFLTSESRPWLRIDGDLRQLDSEPVLSKADVERAVMEIAPESGHESIGRGEATEWLAEFEGVGRIRCTTFTDHCGPGVVLRMIAIRAATAEQLGLSREVQALATEPQGLVLVAGSRTSGKSTLLSALVDLVNRQRADFVITLERQIRLVHDHKSALVSQREIRGGADETVAAARAALRENPDVLVVDDLVSPHMVPLLLAAASEGLLVFVSITASSTSDAVQRFIELAPAETRKAVRSATAESFRGAIAQALLKKSSGGLIAAREVLLATAPVTRVIADGQLGQLPLALESGRKLGMVSFTDALVELVRAGTVDVREAFRKTPDRDRLLEHLKRDGVDTTTVERLA